MSHSTIADARQKEMNANIPVVTTMARVCFGPMRLLPVSAMRSAVASFPIAAKVSESPHGLGRIAAQPCVAKCKLHSSWIFKGNGVVCLGVIAFGKERLNRLDCNLQ